MEQNACRQCGLYDCEHMTISQARQAALDDADYRADDMLDKVFGHIATRPERYTRQDVLTAMHEWLKSQLVLLGVTKPGA